MFTACEARVIKHGRVVPFFTPAGPARRREGAYRASNLHKLSLGSYTGPRARVDSWQFSVGSDFFPDSGRLAVDNRRLGAPRRLRVGPKGLPAAGAGTS